MAGDWRISAEERTKYDLYYQQCSPVQGFVTGDQARNFFIKSGLPAESLRKIWDLSDITNDGRLDKREFTIACHLISCHVQKKMPLPQTLPPTLLSDAIAITANGAPSFMPTLPFGMTRPISNWAAPAQPLVPIQPIRPVVVPPSPLTPAIRSKYLQQFHALVDVTKTNGFMAGLQARNHLQQTGLSQTVLRQIWSLADIDNDGRLTADEFVIAMHCCDIVRAGQILPSRVPDEWLQQGNATQRDRTSSLVKPHVPTALVMIDRELKDAFKVNTTLVNNSSEDPELERKNSMETYEERRQRNYQEGNKELERRRQALREQEEREQREREERERKRELDLQKQKDEQERRKQMDFERQLERQRQIEHKKEEERKRLFEQREAARKEMERKSQLEWERQRMQELSTQKSRLLEQINDLKSRERGIALELQSMDDTIQTNQKKINQTNTNIQTIDQSINDIQKRTMQEKNLLENFEQQRKDLRIKLNRLQTERESIDSSLRNLNQSNEFNLGNRESGQLKFWQTQLDTIKNENTHVDEQITTINQQTKQYQNQMEQLRRQLTQLELDAKNKKQINKISIPTAFTNADQFHANNDFKTQLRPLNIAPSSAIDVDPFQTVDPFASQSDIGSPAVVANHDWFQSTDNTAAKNDPFLSKAENSPRPKKTAPKPNMKSAPTIGPWGASISNNQNSLFTINNERPSMMTGLNSSTSGAIQYRALFDYAPQRPDELAMSAGEIITLDPSQKEQDENWLFGKIGSRQGYFPAAYTERISSTPASADAISIDATSPLMSGSWVIAIADCQGKTVDKHLTFQKGELILVREQKDSSWYSGQLRGKIGWFPRSYVRPATEVEIENKKNTTKNTGTNEKPFASPMSTNGNAFALRQAPKVPLTSDIYEAIYPYEATDPADLSFNAGERIVVLKCDGEWWTGKIGDRTGTFPSNYVQKVDSSSQETALAIAPFRSSDEGRLSFDQGQLIYIRKKGDKGWYQGEIRSADRSVQVGWFPANCVQMQTASPTAPSSGAVYQNTAEHTRYVALFAYDAQQEDELTFPADAILEVLSEAEHTGWFKGRYGNKIGLIPSTYVKPVDERHIPFPTSPNHSVPNSSSNTTTIKPMPQDGMASVLSPTVSNRKPLENMPSNPLRISAIRELIETEQRYVHDLLLVTNYFIKPLNEVRVLNDSEIEQLFINWYNLIELNSNLLKALHQQVDFKENAPSSENGVVMRTPRSVSLSDFMLSPQLASKGNTDSRHRSFTPEVSRSPSLRRLKHRYGTTGHQRSPFTNTARVKSNIEHMDDSSILPSASLLSSESMTILDSTKIGEILCSHLPLLANDYFQYCNYRSQANKALQIKIDSNEQFCLQMKKFQDNTGGLSLHGFLTKPIQRVTRYPLLIEKVVKHTSNDHPDYHSLKQALDCARQLNEKINTQISEQESSSRLDWLQQHLILGSDENPSDGYVLDELLRFNSLTRYNIPRKLLLHGLVTKVPSGKELLGFLFTDFILFSTMKSSSSNWQTQIFEPKSLLQLKLYRLPILLTDVIIANDSLNDQLTFFIKTKVHEKPLTLKTQQTNLRTLWVKSINTAVEGCQAAEKSVLADKAAFSITDDRHHSKAAAARLLLVVQEACDLLPSNITLERHRSIDPYCEITVCSLTLKTPFIKRTTNPKWNAPMQFLLYNLAEDIIHINIFDNEFFSPNENLGCTSVHLSDILPCPVDSLLAQPSLPFTQKIYLNNGSSIVMKCVVQMLTAKN